MIKDQIKEFTVNSRGIYMDNKLVGANIVRSSRYEMIYHTMHLFYKSLNKSCLTLPPESLKEQLSNLIQKDPQKTVYYQIWDVVKEPYKRWNIDLPINPVGWGSKEQAVAIASTRF